MATKCNECMYDAPYSWCCKEVCMELEFCRDCEAKSKGTIDVCLKEDNRIERENE